MLKPEVKNALLIIPPIAGKLIQSGTALSHPFTLNGKNYSLDYNPNQNFDAPFSGRDAFIWNVALTVTSTETFPIDYPRGDTLSEHEISRRRLQIIRALDQKTIEIKSNSATRKECEGQGFGSALISVQDDWIEELIRNFPDRFTGREITALMYDLSRKNSSQDPKKFTGWTSFWAEKLGYSDSGSAWEKKF